MSKIRYVMFITIAGLLSQPISHPTLAAEITCIDDYSASNLKSTDGFALLYPSGRRPIASNCMSILLRGNIQIGDADKFKKLLHDNQPFLANVYLASPGGSVRESVKIGYLIRKHMLNTFAPIGGFDSFKNGKGMMLVPPKTICSGGQDCRCASACFLIWAAGAERTGNVIGLHRPTTDSGDFSKLPVDKAASIYRDELSHIKNYLVEMEVPPNIIDMMADTASNNIYWLTLDEAESLEGMPPSIKESVAVACSNSTLSSEFDRQMCAIRKLANYRDAIVPIDAGKSR